jgi:hypothetical protein
MSSIIFGCLVFASYITLIVVLILKYLRTRDAGFVWLGIAVVIWPLLSRLIDRGERIPLSRVLNHHPAGFFPFSLVDRGVMTIGDLLTTLALLRTLIGVSLLLIAVFFLRREKRGSD